MTAGDQLSCLLDEAVATGLFSAITSCVCVDGRSRWSHASGLSPGAGESPLFDAASLTKLFVSTLAIQLDRPDGLALDRLVRDWFPEAASDVARSSLQDLLRHRSGLAAWAPLYSLCSSTSDVDAYLVSQEAFSGDRPCYSDLGFILYGRLLEIWSGRSLGEVMEQVLIDDLGLSLFTRDVPSARAVVCHCDTEREVELARARGETIPLQAPPLPGQVQDGNARFLGGLAGHAGIFLDLEGLLDLGRRWVDWLTGPGEGVAGRARRAIVDNEGFGLGWRTKRRDGRLRIGHLGFTGGSLWIEPESATVFATLGHRRSATSDLSGFRTRLDELGGRIADSV